MAILRVGIELGCDLIGDLILGGIDYLVLIRWPVGGREYEHLGGQRQGLH